jgi:hypothetical protein
VQTQLHAALLQFTRFPDALAPHAYWILRYRGGDVSSS